MKRFILAVVCLFVLWSALDFVIHEIILGGVYEATASLWRPMPEMMMGLLHISVVLFALVFTTIYASFFKTKNTSTGLKYGFLLGLGTGFSMGYCTYAVMPIPHLIALIWFIGTLVEFTLGGLLVGLIIKDNT